MRRDRPEFVHLASMSSGITSQNGQTQTEDRKMDVRGCTKGKGGDTTKKRKGGGRQHCQEVVEGERGVGDTTRQQYDTTMTKTDTEHTNKTVK